MSFSLGNQKHEENECSGPRPPVPGEESHVFKMTEGVSENSRNSPPSYLNWARTLNHLLEDRDGVELFKKYVEEEAPAYNDHLNFYFACEGLKQQTDPEKIKQIIGAIYRFLRKSKLTISEDLRHNIKAGLKNEIPLSPHIYDNMQQSVEVIIREKIYLNFCCSDIYILYIQKMSEVHEQFSNCTTATGSGSASSSGTSCGSNGGATTIGTCGLSACNVRKTALSMLSTGTTVNIPLSMGSTGTVYTTGICSLSGSVYGPSTSASSSGSISATDTLPRSSTLPTLHEDSELSLPEDFKKTHVESDSIASDIPIRLTRELLLATEKRRLEIRPPGAHGYVYHPVNTNTSYVPNSRVDSERGSVSSGGRTDSDTISISSCSVDGRPYIQRRHSSTESKAIRQSAMANKETNNFQVIPRTQRLHSNEHRPLKEQELIAMLIPKLEEVKRKQEIDERARQERYANDTMLTTERIASDRAFAEVIREKFTLDEDNDQDILDQHVSRVWKDQTPHRSPGAISPCPPLPSRRRTNPHDLSNLTDISESLIKHSKSMPDHSSSSGKLTNKWPSINTDSGISLFSTDTFLKYKETSCRSGSTIASKPEEAKKRLEDEARRSRRYIQQHLSQNQQTSSFNINHNASHSLALQTPPPLPAKSQETTTVVFSFCDEEYPYRTKIPGIHPTLKQFKDYLPKKGNFRFFFKTHCEDADNPVIQEEIVNDSDILPLFEGKVMGLVKPSD